MKRLFLLFSLFIALMFTSNVFGQEEIIYQTGFEAGEEFAANTTYNNTTIAYTGPEGKRWGTYYGTPSTTSPISGGQTMQMRWYSSSPNDHGYSFIDFNLEKATKVEFKAKNTNNIKVEVSYSTDGGNVYISPESFTLTTTATDYTYQISNTGEFNNVRLKFQLTYTNAPTSTSRLYIDDVKVYGMVASTPSLTVNPSSLTDFTYSLGNGPSSSQSFALSISNLDPADGDITVTPPSNYEVSIDNTGFSSSAITIPYTDGTLSSTNIYVRLKEGLAVGNYNGSININGGGANQQTVALSGSVSNAMAPVLTVDNTNNNVDNDIEITFTDNATWRAAITAVKVGSSSLNSADFEILPGTIKLKPSVGNSLLTVSGTKAITVSATEYSDAIVSQIINPGAPASLVVTTQPAAPATNGAVLATQPVISIKDQYNNTVNTQVTVIAAADEDSWTLGGATSKTTSNGTATFTDLTATSENAVSNAEIDFSYASLSVTSSPFTIPAPPLSVPIALEATNINPTGFTANWTSVSSSDSYRLDVYDSEYEISFFEGFDNIGASSSSYSTRTWLGNNDISWTAIDARTDQTINGKAICIKNGYLESSAISMQSPIRVEFMITTPYSGSGNLKLYISYDDTFSSQIFGGEYNYGEDSDNVMVQFNNIQSVDGPFKIKIVNTSGRIVIDDLSFDIMYPNYVPGYQNITVSGTSYDVTGLTSGEYYYRVRAVRDTEVSSNSNVINVLVSQQIHSVAVGEWYLPEIWSSNTVPTIYDDVIISEDFPVTVSGTSNCSSINVLSDLIIEDYASLIVKNQAQGEVTIKRYIDDEDHHLVSLPVTNTISAGPTFNGFYVDEYSEPTGSWTRLVDENNMLPMKGYSVARTSDAPTDLVFNGPIKGGAAVFTDLSFTSGAPGYSEGWNLIGNPFTSGIALEAGTDFSGLNGNIYAWNVESGNYESSSLLDGSGTLHYGFIKFFEGFFVRTLQSTNHLSIPTSAKVHGLKAPTKSSKINELKLAVSGNNYSDIMMFVINPESTYGFDEMYDAYKLYGNADAPQLYTIAGAEKTTVSHIPAIDGLSELQVLLEVGAENQYTLAASDIEGFMPGTGVILKDKLTGQTVNLRENSVYTFTAKPGDVADRFSLLFSPLGTPEAMSLQANVYAIDKEIRVQLNESAKGEVKITSLAGQVLLAKAFESSTQVTLKAPAQSGIYMVTVVTEKGIMTRKVFIK